MRKTLVMAAAAMAWAPAGLAQEMPPSPAGTIPGAPAETAEPNVLPGDIGGSVALTSDYVFRGISQSDESAAIQGSLDWTHESGAFAGVWGSSVDFDDGDQASAELDWYAGWAGEFRPVEIDLRAIYYSYPGADTARDYDYWELGATGTVTPLADLDLSLGYNYSPDFFNESGSGHYLHGAAAYTVAGLIVPASVSVQAGRQWINDNGAFGTPDYWHWGVGAGITVEKVDLSVTYSDTDLSRAECGGGLDTCGERILVTAATSF